MVHRTVFAYASIPIAFVLAVSPSQSHAQGLCFEDAPSIGVGLSVSSFATGDLDDDGDRDVVISTGTSLEALFNNGNGTFAAPVTSPASTNLESFSLVDLDGDGDLDSIGFVFFSSAVLVRKNLGGGTFGAALSYSTNGQHVFSLAHGDIDGDGDVDVTTTNTNTHIQSVLRNQGDGSFGAPVTYVTGGSAGPSSTLAICVGLADMDGDADLDLVGALAAAGSFGGVSKITVRKNDGNGNFGAVGLTSVPHEPMSVTLDDFDGDGDRDVAFNGEADGDMTHVFFNAGNGTFSGSASYPTQNGNSYGVMSSDLDGDGDRDLTVQTITGIRFLVNDGLGVFTVQPIITGLRGFPIGDLDGDLRTELATNASSGGGITVRRSCLTTPHSYCFGDGSEAACPCDNPGYVGSGCSNILYDSGARLTASGTASVSADSLVLTSSSMSGVQSWYFQATGHDAVPFGRGILCVSGALIRIGQKEVVGGSSTNPTPGDFPLSVKGAIPPSGGTRYYQVSYRHANPVCTPAPVSNTNRTNGLAIVWTP